MSSNSDNRWGLGPSLWALVQHDGDDERESFDRTGVLPHVAFPDADHVAKQPPGHEAVRCGLMLLCGPLDYAGPRKSLHQPCLTYGVPMHHCPILSRITSHRSF